MNRVRTTLERLLQDALERGGAGPDTPISDDFGLIGNGIDSLGLAMVIAGAEQALGYDPFELTDDASYPTTFGALVAFYEQFDPRREGQ